MNKPLFSYLLILGLTVATFGSAELKAAQETVAKALWSNFDGGNHVLLTASYDGEDWSEPLIIHESENPMTSVAVGTADNDTELLVWTEQVKQQSQLFHKWFSRKSGLWSEAQLLSDFGKENIGASIIVDPTQRLHLFWSATKTDFSDIVHMSYANGRWSKIQTIHDTNDVPDIQPKATLDLNGNVVVTWSSYSSDAGQYVELQKIVETASPADESTKSNLVDAVKLTQIPLPDFLPNDSSATIYFPQNSMVQSAPTKP